MLTIKQDFISYHPYVGHIKSGVLFLIYVAVMYMNTSNKDRRR
jgi:hypothetical protein